MTYHKMERVRWLNWFRETCLNDWLPTELECLIAEYLILPQQTFLDRNDKGEGRGKRYMLFDDDRTALIVGTRRKSILKIRLRQSLVLGQSVFGLRIPDPSVIDQFALENERGNGPPHIWIQSQQIVLRPPDLAVQAVARGLDLSNTSIIWFRVDADSLYAKLDQNEERLLVTHLEAHMSSLYFYIYLHPLWKCTAKLELLSPS